MQTLWQDLRYGARILRKNPGFTFVVVLTLSLGIGANTAIFSVINAVLLRPLPFAEPQRIVAVGSRDYSGRGNIGSVSYPDFMDYQAQSRAFERLAAYGSRNYTLTTNEGAARLRGAVATSDLFPLLGVNPLVGRTFEAREDKAGGGRAVVLSHGLWQRRFSADPGMIGQTLTLNGHLHTVVGVMPPGFRFPFEAEPVEFWTNFTPHAEGPGALTAQRGNHAMQVVGRLKPGVTVAQASGELEAIARNLEKQYPDTNTGFGAAARPLLAEMTGEVKTSLLVIFAAVGCVLLIGCANVANLLLARAASRRREIAVRTALGASGWRVVRQLLTESLLLGLVGGAAGVLVASFGTDLLLKLTPTDIPRLGEAAMDARVLLFTLGVSVLTGLLMGVVPAWQTLKLDVHGVLKDGGRGTVGGLKKSARGAFVVAEVALAMVLLVAAGLLLQSFARLIRTDAGFHTERLLTLRLTLPDGIYRTNEQRVNFNDRLLAAIGGLPGVSSFSTVTPLPLSRNNFTVGFNVEGRPNAKGVPYPYESGMRLVSPGYFRTLGVTLKEGRDFTARDTAESPQVVLINEALARKHFPGENPLGKRINPSVSVGGEPAMREIIGVVADTRGQSLGQEARPEVYASVAQLPAFGSLYLAVRTEADPQGIIGMLREKITELDRNVPIYDVRTLEEYVSASVARPRFNTLLIGLFAGVALLLTAVGLYGVVAYSVAERTQEIGIRMALGADKRDVLGLVIRQGMGLVLVGAAIGLAGAFALTRLMASLLYGVRATDPLTFAGVALVVLLVTLAACYIPARRAARIDPMVALRYE
jgi:putative ABC transport system permease protein